MLVLKKNVILDDIRPRLSFIKVQGFIEFAKSRQMDLIWILLSVGAKSMGLLFVMAIYR